MRPQRANEDAVPGAAVREHLLERPVRPLPGPRRLLRDAGGVYAANGLIGLVFAATGPVAVILAVGAQGGLSQEELASWIFGAFFLNGVLTVVACWLYRQPLAFFWTIPGTVLVGPALTHLTWPQVVGAFFATGLLVLLLGLSGWVRRAMAVVPMPIVMAMVAGIFLRFGIDLVHSLRDDVLIAAPMVVTFLLLSALPRLGRRIPPIIGGIRRPRPGSALSSRKARTMGAAIPTSSRRACTRSIPNRRKIPATMAITIGIGTTAMARRTQPLSPRRRTSRPVAKKAPTTCGQVRWVRAGPTSTVPGMVQKKARGCR